MLYINSNSSEIKEVLDIYKLPVSGPEISQPGLLAEYVFEKCYHLIPNDIKKFFNVEIKTSSFFKAELIWHIITNAYMVYLSETEGNVNRNGALFSKVSDFFYTSIAKRDPVRDLFEGKDIHRAAKERMKKMGDYWMLPLSNSHSHFIPAFVSPLLAFQVMHADSHKVIKDYTNSEHSYNFQRRNKDESRNVHLHFYDNFKYLLDNFPNIDKIHGLFEKNQLRYHPTINRILFEREYQLGLASKIATSTYLFSDEFKKRFFQILSPLAMLPNINGRLYYLTSMLLRQDLVRSSMIGSLDSNLATTHSLCTSLIGMALITIPVMESYFLYLWKNGDGSFENRYMQKNMQDYEEISFSDERSEPLSFSEGVKIPGVNIHLNGKWALTEVPFKQIKEILTPLNQALDIKRLHLNKIYLSPLEYLKTNGYDRYTLMTLISEAQIINAVSENVKATHFN